MGDLTRRRTLVRACLGMRQRAFLVPNQTVASWFVEKKSACKQNNYQSIAEHWTSQVVLGILAQIRSTNSQLFSKENGFW